jgi:exopolyphosphatase/pppGpp-phosphohydrolase
MQPIIGARPANRQHPFETLLRERMTVQMGKSALTSGRLDARSLERAVGCIHEFRRLALCRQVERIVAVATSAVRGAENGEDFIHQIRCETGIGVRAISGREEARLLESSLKLNSLQRADKLDMDLSRSEYFPTALLCLNTILERVDAGEFVLSPYSLREGLVYDFIAQNGFEKRKWGRISSAELRDGPVRDLAIKCNYPREHSERVARLAGQIFEQTKSLHCLGEMARKLLRDASILHDIGYHIAYEKHHKHGAYLVMNGELRGFALREREMLAQLVRYHRGAKPKRSHPQFAALPKECRKKIKYLAAILRLADSLDRSHSQVIEEVRCSLTKETMQFQLFTVALSADVDLALQSARRKARYFEKVLGCNTLFQTVQFKDAKAERKAHSDVSSPIERKAHEALQNNEDIAQCPVNAPALKLATPRQAPAKTSVG